MRLGVCIKFDAFKDAIKQPPSLGSENMEVAFMEVYQHLLVESFVHDLDNRALQLVKQFPECFNFSPLGAVRGTVEGRLRYAFPRALPVCEFSVVFIGPGVVKEEAHDSSRF